MKKSMGILVMALFFILLSACGQADEPVEAEPAKDETAAETKAEKKKEEAPAQDKDLTMKQVFEKAIEKNNDVKSFASKMETKQKIDVAGQQMDINSKIDMKFITEPMALQQKMKMDTPDGPQEVEAYVTKDGFYMYEMNEKMWVKLPKEYSDEILQMAGPQANPSAQLEDMLKYADDFSYEEKDDSYILNLKAGGEKFDQFVKENMENAMGGNLPSDSEELDNLKIKQMEYKMVIDKETFYMKGLDMKMETESEVQGEKMSMHLDLKSVYSDFNQIKKIEIPEEAVKNAQEIDPDQMQ